MGIFKAVKGAAKAAQAARDINSDGGVGRVVSDIGQAAMSAVPGARMADRLSRGRLSGAIDQVGDRAQSAVDSRGGLSGMAQTGLKRGLDMAAGYKDTRKSLSSQFDDDPYRSYDPLSPSSSQSSSNFIDDPYR